MRVVLTIAGSDPVAGAGLQADLKTIAAFGVYGLSAATAITVQNTRGVSRVVPLSADLVEAQIEAVASDIPPDATKIGMLGTAAIVEVVAAAIADLELPLVVIDPVMLSTSGAPLLDDDGRAALVRELMPRARVVTPNIPEAEALSGIRIVSVEDARTAARRICDLGVQAAIVTGGHGMGAEIVDVMCDRGIVTEFATARVGSQPVHGTGCTFASAIAAGLALGHPLDRCVASAQAYIAGAVAHAIVQGHGAAVLLNHFWRQGGDAATDRPRRDAGEWPGGGPKPVY